ncbi:MAG: hypothetical protein Kow00121_30850 [Elainellaceae cyanobacterium]
MTISISPMPLHQLADGLSEPQQDQLRRYQPLITGDQGNYIGWILANAPLEQVWSVLTDYSQFPQFLPTVVAAEILETNGDRKVVEQTDQRRLLLMNVKSKVRTENIEKAPDRIDFRLLEGDLKTLQGRWKIHLAVVGENQVQTLITQTVNAEANAGLFEGMFHQVFESSLRDNLKAIRDEAEQRS